MIGKWREQLDSKLRGQSEVLGVALLTAVVVILVATVALFLFTDFASDANDEQLLATVESDVTSENITIEHQGGDSFEPENVSVILQGDTTYETTLSAFSDPADDNSSFSPGDTWTDSGLTLAGEFRLLVIDTKSNTILHDQTHEVKIKDVRLLVNDSSTPPTATQNDVTMPGADPATVGNKDQIRRGYVVQVKYNTGEGWKNQTGGTSSLNFDPASGANPLSVVTTSDTGGVLQADEPNPPGNDQQDIDVSFSTNTGSSAVDDDIQSNTVTVTVIDADIETDTTLDVQANPGDIPSENQVEVDWEVENTGDQNLDPANDFEFSLEDGDGNPIDATADASGASNVDDCTESGSNVTCSVEFSGETTLTVSGGELPMVSGDVDPDTEEVTAVAVPSFEQAATQDSYTDSQTFDAAKFESTGGGALFNKPAEAVDITFSVENTGSWTAGRDIGVVAKPQNGPTLLNTTTLASETDRVLEPGEEVNQSTPAFSDVDPYEIPVADGKTDEVDIEVNVDGNTVDTFTSDSMNPAKFEVTSVSASVAYNASESRDQVVVDYTVENTGDLTHRQDIWLQRNLTNTGDRNDSVTLGPGDTVSGTFYDGDDFQAGGNDYTVQTEDTEKTTTITIDPADFSVTIQDVSYTYDGTDDVVTVEYTIENTGNLVDTRDLDAAFTFKNSSTTLDTATEQVSSKQLAGGDSEVITNTTVIENYRTDEIEVNVSVLESGSATDFDVSTVTPTPGNINLTIRQAESNRNGEGKIYADYNISNAGDLARTTDIGLVRLNSTGDNEVLANFSDTGAATKTLRGGNSFEDTLSGQLENGDSDGSVVNIRVNATSDNQDSSQEEKAVPTTPATVEFRDTSGSPSQSQSTWTEDGEDLKVDSYTVENTGDVPSQSQQVTYTMDVASSGLSLLSTSSNEFGTSDLLGDITSALDGFEKSDSVPALDPDPNDKVTGDFTGSQAFTLTDVLGGLLGNVDSLELRATLSTDDDTDTYNWTVQPPTYQPSVTSATHDISNEEVDVDWKVENTGNFANGQKDIRFFVNGNQVDTLSEEIQPGSPETGSRSETVTGPSPIDGDVINVTVATEDGTATELVNVDSHYFDASINDATFTQAAPGSDASVSLDYTVENTGDFDGTQDIEFLVNGNVQDTNGGVTLSAGGGTTSDTFSTTVSQSVLDPSNEFTASVRTANETETATLSAQPAYFQINNVDATFENEQAKLTSWTVENTGDFTDTQTIEFLVNSGQRDSVSRTLAPGETTSGSFSDGVTQSVLDASNEFTVSLSTDNETETRTLSAQPASFDITSVNFAFEQATSSDPAQARVTTYTVENTGDFTATQDIEFVIDNGGASVRDSVTRTLGPGETDSGSFSAPVSETTQFTARLQTQDDSASQTFNPSPSYLAITSHSLNFNDGTASGSYTVENTGDFTANQNVDFEVDGNIERSDSVSVAPGNTASGSFSATAPDPGQQNYDLEVAIDSQDERVSDTFTVDTAYFEVTSVSASYNTGTQSADTTYTIENTGDFQNSKTITIEALTDNNQATESVTLGPGDSVTNTKSVGITSAGSQTIQVSTPDDAGTDTIFVSGPTFTVQSVTATYDVSNEEALVDFTIENTGDLQGTRNVDVTTDPGGAGGSRTFNGVTRGPGGTFSKSDVRVDITDSGTIDLVVSTGDDSDRDSINVDPASFEVVGLSASSSFVSPGSTVDISVDIKNTGEITGTVGTVDIDPKIYAVQSVTIGPGQTVTSSKSASFSRSDAPSVQFCAGVGFVGCGDSSLETTTVTVNAPVQVTGDNIDVNANSNGLGSCGGWYNPGASTDLTITTSVTLDDPSNNFNEMTVTFDVTSGFGDGDYGFSDQTESSTSITVSDSDCTYNPLGSTVTVESTYTVDDSSGGTITGFLSGSDGF